MTAIDSETEAIRAIKQLIQAFFDSINAADPEGLQTHFFPGANITILRQDPPREPSSSQKSASSKSSLSSDEEATTSRLTVVIRSSIEKFAKLLEEGQKKRKGQLPGPILYEAPDLGATDVKIDGLFATAWSPFTVLFDGVLHHYGIMSFTLGKTDATGGTGAAKEWKIENLTQDYKRTPGWEVEVRGEQSNSFL